MDAAVFDPEAIEKFQKAVLTRDVAGVWNALEAGVDPSTPVGPTNAHPLDIMLRVPYKTFAATEYKGDINDEEDYNRRGSEIVELLLAQGIKLVEPEKYATIHHAYLVDKLLTSPRYKDLSTVVIEAIRQSLDENGELYEPDAYGFSAAFLATVTPKGIDFEGGASTALNMLERMHDLVQKRLQNPQTKTERYLVSNYKEEVTPWVEPFNRPALAELRRKIKSTPMEVPAAETRGQKPPAASKAEQESALAKLVQHLDEPRPGMDRLETPAEILERMETELVGMEQFKQEMRDLYAGKLYDDVCREMEIPVMDRSYHAAIVGNPGTGKTSALRLRAELLFALGEAGPRYVEISREQLVGKFIGHTEANMVELLKNADQVFIDEAYNLSDGSENDFGKQVINVLITALENRRDDLVFSFAGYPEPMKNFFASNPGFGSRVPEYTKAADFSIENLGEILDRQLARAQRKLEPEAREYILEQLQLMKKEVGERDFGNGRVVRTIVEKLPTVLARRLFPVDATAEGLAKAFSARAAVKKKDMVTFTKKDVMALDISAHVKSDVEQTKKRKIGFSMEDHQARLAKMQPVAGISAALG